MYSHNAVTAYARVSFKPLNKVMSVKLSYPISEFLQHIGGEGAYKVSLETAIMRALGYDVYGLNIGDIDGTEITPPMGYQQGLIQAALGEKLTYGPTQGNPRLRDALADKVNREYGVAVDGTFVSISASKSNIFKTEVMLLDAGVPFSYPIPGYPIYQSIGQAKGADLQPYSFTFTPNPETRELEVDIDIDSVKRCLDAGVKVFVLNDAQNPSGHSLSASSVQKLRDLFNLPHYQHVFVMFDIAYENIRFDGQSHVRGLIKELFEQGRACILGTASKEDAMTGERLGFTVFPKTDVVGNPTLKTLVEAFNKLTGNIESSSPTSSQAAWLYAFAYGHNVPEDTAKFIAEKNQQIQAVAKEMQDISLGLAEITAIGGDTSAAYKKLGQLQSDLNKAVAELRETDPLATQEANLRKNLGILQQRRDVLCEALSTITGLYATRPSAGFYVWADVTELIEKLGFGTDVEKFRKTVLAQTGVSFCSDEHFGNCVGTYPGRRFVRFAFSGISEPDIKKAMVKFKSWIDARHFAIEHFAGKQVAVVGGGPIGQVTTHRLNETGVDVTIISKYGKKDIEERGIRLSLPVPLESHPAVQESLNNLDAQQNVIMLSTQLPKTDAEIEALALQLSAKLAKDGVVICLQNGIDTGKELALKLQELGRSDVVVARSVIFVQIRDGVDPSKGLPDGSFSIPKEMRWPVTPVLNDYEPDQLQRLTDLGKALSGTGMKGMDAVSFDEGQVLAWNKLFNNLGNYASLELAKQGLALTYGDVLQDTSQGRLARESLFEAVKELHILASRTGFHLPKTPEAYFRDVLAYLKTTHICTTVNAYSKGKEMENLLLSLLPDGSQTTYPTLWAYSNQVESTNQDRSLHALREVVPQTNLESRYQACMQDFDAVIAP